MDLGPLPVRMFQREIGRLGRRKEEYAFNDLGLDTMQTLMTCLGQSQKVNLDSYPGSPIPIYSLQRVGNEQKVLVGDESGRLHIVSNWFTPTFPNLESKACPAHSIRICDKSAVCAAKYAEGKLFVGSGHGQLCILDMETRSFLKLYDCHEKCVKKVDSLDGEVIVSCGKDNLINLYDLRVKSEFPVNSIRDAHSVLVPGTRHGRQKLIKNQGVSASNSVADVVFVDEHRLISCGASDGRLKEWDLRVTYKHMKKSHPVAVVEYPLKNKRKGFTCMQLKGRKLFVSSFNYEIFQYDVGTMLHETTYTCDSKLNNFTRIDLSHDGSYLATGTEEPKVHIFKTVKGISNQLNQPIHTLVHDNFYPVCCPLFSPVDDFVLTTGADDSILTKWAPSVYLTSSKDLGKIAFKKGIESPPTTILKTEFTSYRRQKLLYRNWNGKENKETTIPHTIGRSGQRVCFAKLDSFPNYVIDGMRLPHVVPKIRIKLRNKLNSSPANWLMSPSARRQSVAGPLAVTPTDHEKEITPKRKVVARKRKKFCDDSLSPKILSFFKVTSNSSPKHVAMEH